MKRIYAMTLAGVLCAAAGAAGADSISLNSFKPQFIPVLVQVNSAGKVTDASPAVELPVPVMRLLRKNLDELIAGPATTKGRPVASQFVMNLTLQTSLRKDGQYDAQFAYVSTSPVPSGSWYWVNLDGHRLALANRNSYNGARHYYPFRNLFREEPDFHRQNSALPGPTPLMHDTAPAPHPNPGK